MLAISCFRFGVFFVLLVDCSLVVYFTSFVGCWLLVGVVCCSLFFRVLFVVLCLLFVACSSLFVVRCLFLGCTLVVFVYYLYF